MGEETGYVRAMALLRVLSAAIEVSAALLMLRLGRLESAVQINAALGLIGPAILITVTLLGVAGLGLAGRLPPTRLLLLLAGIGLIVAAARR